MTLAATYEANKCETSRKPSIKKKPAELLGTGHQCKDGLYKLLGARAYP
jgi:hypothetical protein